MTTQENRDLREFIDAFNANPPWNDLVIEEAKEVNEAVAHLLKELVDFSYVITGAKVTHMFDQVSLRANPDVKTANKWLQILVKAIPVDMQYEAWDRVHASNMSKLDDNGKPIRREDGKILKSKNYAPPDLLTVVMGV